MPNSTGETRPTPDPHPGPANPRDADSRHPTHNLPPPPIVATPSSAPPPTPPPARAPSKEARARKRSGPRAKTAALRLRPMTEDAPRYTALWDRIEMLVIAFLQDHWRPAPVRPDAAPDDEAAIPSAAAPTGRKTASGSTSSRAKPDPPSSQPGPMTEEFAPLCPPGVELPLRPGPPVRELASAIVCLRRIQDARFALDQKSTGDNDHEEDLDPNTGIPGRHVRRLAEHTAGSAEAELDEETQ